MIVLLCEHYCSYVAGSYKNCDFACALLAVSMTSILLVYRSKNLSLYSSYYECRLDFRDSQ